MKKHNLKLSSKLIGLTIIFISIMTLVSSCSDRILDFTAISSKNVTLHVKKDTPRVVGKKSPTIKGAIDNAIESAGVGYDALIDGVIYKHTTPCVFFDIIRFHVEGTPIKTSELEKK